MSRLTDEKGCLSHDDRADALAIALAYFVEAAAQDQAATKFHGWGCYLLSTQRRRTRRKKGKREGEGGERKREKTCFPSLLFCSVRKEEL